MRYGFHPEARLEYREAAVFYEARRPALDSGLSDGLLDTDHALSR